MQTIKKLEELIEEETALKTLTQVYEEVALSKISEIRDQVLATRRFLTGVEEVYKDVKASYIAHVLSDFPKKERERQLGIIKRNGKTVVVLISANESLLGAITLAVYKTFWNFCLQTKGDYVVLGEIGRYLLQFERPKVAFSYFEMDDYKIEEGNFLKMLRNVSSYERIIVVYPRFESVLRQAPAVEEISGGSMATLDFKKVYFFEPSVSDVVSYFEGQIIGVLLRQKLLESMLAKYAARLTIMDRASLRVEKLILVYQRQRILAQKRKENRSLLDIFGGYNIWRKR